MALENELAGAVLQLDHDGGGASRAGGEIVREVFASVVVGPGVGEQIARRRAAVFHLGAANDGEHRTGVGEVALQASGGGGLGERELHSGMQRAHMVVRECAGRQLEQMRRTRGRGDDPESLAEREVGGLHAENSHEHVGTWQRPSKKWHVRASWRWRNVMNTLTLTQRFGVPVCLAAAIHAVLLFAFVPATRSIDFPPPVELPRPRPFPEGLIEILRPPADPAPTNAATVKPLGGGPTAPVLPDDVTGPRNPWIEMPHEPARPSTPHRNLTVVPGGPGGPGELVGPGTWGPPATPVFGIDRLDRTPRAVAQPAPDYPFALRQSGVTGQVFVEFEVDTAGRVVTARIVRGGEKEFEEAALRAVLKWRFEPGRKDGRAVPFRMAVPIGFNLTED